MKVSNLQRKTGEILIVDDTPDNLRLLSELLTKAGYTVRRVINGELGLEAAQLEPPDLILLDIRMPGLNGYKVCDQLKSSDRTAQIPVIFLSAMNEELDKVMAFEAGGVDYITKPFQVVEVLARIETHLQVSRLRQILQQQNAQLQLEIAQRTSAETAFEILNQGLESRIRERTIDLQAQNEQLLQQQASLQQKLEQEQHLNSLQINLIKDMVKQLETALENISTALPELTMDPSPTERAALAKIASATALIDRLMQQGVLLTETKVAPRDTVIRSINLTQFCQNFVAQWQLPTTPEYQLSFVNWGKSPGDVPANEALLRQIFAHLLSNAVRYSPQGGTILFQLVYERNQAIIQIRDEGIGIPEIDLNRVFDRFYRASNVPDSGLGLGLTLVKQAIELQGGTVSISSEVEQGTIVTLTLPYSNA